MKKKDAQLIQDIKNFLDTHLYESYTIIDLCRQFSINREKLQNGFHELTNYTVHAYIISERMGQAAQRLIDTDDSIKAIALDSGYKKQRSFNKTFKSIYKMTPASYRRQHTTHRELQP